MPSPGIKNIRSPLYTVAGALILFGGFLTDAIPKFADNVDHRVSLGMYLVGGLLTAFGNSILKDRRERDGSPPSV